MANKSGGDVTQANVGGQFNASSQESNGVANAGPSIVDSIGGAAFLGQDALQDISQALSQANLGVGGAGGSDNIHADTNITIA